MRCNDDTPRRSTVRPRPVTSLRRFGAFAAMLSLVALVGGLLAPTEAGADVRKAPDPRAKVENRLESAFAKDGRQDFWIRFAERADTSAARRMDDWTKRGAYVHDELTKVAAESQRRVRQRLDADDVTYEAFWVSNAILVRDGSQALALRMAAMSEVGSVRQPRAYRPVEPVESRPATKQPRAAEWGVSRIRAPEVWSTYGATGEGVTVANVDTGVQYDHPALAAHYRGYTGPGQVDHDYNWLDTGSTSPDAPADGNGHGTHTMGTMVGDDGTGNQVGVAPGAKWIAANGCCASDQTLIDSGQWMLAPTDLQGANADPGKRPHVVNNSWGTTLPTNDPFMEDVLLAWGDSGIFGVFSNGNNGEMGCASSGAPGSRVATYAVGATDSADRIASFSSRGAGQDGEVKPNISAPGAAVRSAWPGGTYQTISGTSMAAPHVAGAVALLWSAVPGLVGDVDGTRALLDETAVDTSDLTCGGTADDNNVYGEGRLDALALVELGKHGGTLTGRVTDATGAPIAGATVTASGPSQRTATTDVEGGFGFPALAGSYEVRVTAYGHDPHETTGVVVTTGESTRHDVTLQPTERVDVAGVVGDGSGHGWPLYAKVTASDADGHEVTAYSDPVTGRYRLAVLPDTEYTVHVVAQDPGYTEAKDTVDVASGDVAKDVDLAVDALACTALGYRAERSGTTQTFDAANVPTGWRVANSDPVQQPGWAYTPGWQFTNPGDRPNDTGGTGNAAIVDSDHTGARHVQDTTLTSPAMDLSDATRPVVRFASDLEPAVNSRATVDVSVDGGSTWSTVWRRAGFPGARGPGSPVVGLPTAAGQADVRVRFGYVGSWSKWWQVDDVFVGQHDCAPVAGGIVTGLVTATGGQGLVGASVTADADPQARATTVATPDDPAVGDGLYRLFSAATGEQTFTAAKAGYASTPVTVTVTADAVTSADVELTPTG